MVNFVLPIYSTVWEALFHDAEQPKFVAGLTLNTFLGNLTKNRKIIIRKKMKKKLFIHHHVETENNNHFLAYIVQY